MRRTFLMIFAVWLGKTNVPAQQDSVFIGWDIQSPFSKELPKQHYYHYSDTLNQPWEAGFFPNPNNGEFIVTSNRWKDKMKLTILDASLKVLFDQVISVDSFYYKPRLKLIPGIYKTLIQKDGHPIRNIKMRVTAMDTAEEHGTRQRAERNAKQVKKFSASLSPNSGNGKFAVIIESKALAVNEDLEIVIMNQEKEKVKEFKLTTFHYIAMADVDLAKGDYFVEIKNSKKESCTRLLKIE